MQCCLIEIVSTCSANRHSLLNRHSCQLVSHLLRQKLGSVLQTFDIRTTPWQNMSIFDAVCKLTTSCFLDKSEAQCASERILST